MTEITQRGYGEVKGETDEYEGRVMFETWSRPKGTVLLEFWGMSGDRTDDLDSYVFLQQEEAENLAVNLLMMAGVTSQGAYRCDDALWVDDDERAWEEPLVDGAIEYHEESKEAKEDVEVQSHLGVYKDTEENDGMMTEEERERLAEVLVEEFDYEPPSAFEFEAASFEEIKDALDIDDEENDDDE